MRYKRLFPALLVPALLALAFAASLGLAQSLPALTPPGAAAGLYTRNLAVKQTFFIDFQAEWNRLGLGDSIQRMLEEDGELNADDLELARQVFTLDLVGREGILVFYPSGDFFALARPSASRVDTIIKLLDRSMQQPETRNGWKLDRSDSGGSTLYLGHNGQLVLLGSAGAVERFLNGDRGLKPPIEGDLVFWVDAEPLAPLIEQPDLGLTPQMVRSLKTFAGLAWSLDVQQEGLFTRSRLTLNPDQDGELARILLPSDQAWPLDDLPRGIGASSYAFDLAALGDYISAYAQQLGQDLPLDLSAFGNHFALIDAGTEDPQEALKNSLGNLLLVLETRDSLTAEVTLLSWIQALAGFATPEGSGGFRVEPQEIAGMPAKKITVGLLGDLYLVTGTDRIYLATSDQAARLLETGERFASDKAYQELSKAHLPDRYSGVSYANNQKSLQQTARMLPLLMMQTIDDPQTQAQTAELADRFAQFVDFLATRVGSSLSYQQVQGDHLVGLGFTEVTW